MVKTKYMRWHFLLIDIGYVLLVVQLLRSGILKARPCWTSYVRN